MSDSRRVVGPSADPVIDPKPLFSMLGRGHSLELLDKVVMVDRQAHRFDWTETCGFERRWPPAEHRDDG